MHPFGFACVHVSVIAACSAESVSSAVRVKKHYIIVHLPWSKLGKGKLY